MKNSYRQNLINNQYFNFMRYKVRLLKRNYFLINIKKYKKA